MLFSDFSFSSIDKNEKKIFIRHLFYSIIEGILAGIIILNEFVFVKALKGTQMQLAVLFQTSVIVFFFSIVIHELLKRYKKQHILKTTALVTRLPLLAIFFFPVKTLSPDEMAVYHYIFLLIFLFYYLAMPVIFPIINSILKHNYSRSHFGTLYSWVTTINKIVMMVSTMFFGLMLDKNPFCFTKVYPVMGILGIISVFWLSTALRIDYLQADEKKRPMKRVIMASLGRMKEVIKTNKPYRDFETGFMLYGFSFMLTASVITLFLSEKLELNYTSIAFYKNSYNLIAIVLLPFFGRLIDRVDPRKFAAFTFFTLLMHLLFMGLTQYFPYCFDAGEYRFYLFLIISYAWNGLFAATMSLLWNIGSAYFCTDGDAGTYQSIHLSLVGARAIAAPIFGIWIYQYIGFTGVFMLGVSLLSLAVITMFWSIGNETRLIRF